MMVVNFKPLLYFLGFSWGLNDLPLTVKCGRGNVTSYP